MLRTADHGLLYDAESAFHGGLDMGEAAVLPALRALGVRRLDTIVLSHHHDDHVGGAGALRRAYPGAQLLAGEPTRTAGSEACVTGQAWAWNGVRLEMLHPTPHFPEMGNESSCVLRIVGAGASLLLTGDIGEVIESRLLRTEPERLPSTVLVVPHHGSHSSSSSAFVSAVAPELALVGVGHRNRFGHPREVVVDRYRQQRSRLLDTASDGAITVRAAADGVLHVSRRRDSHRRFWHEP
jgi:competence protein ComEC